MDDARSQTHHPGPCWSQLRVCFCVVAIRDLLTDARSGADVVEVAPAYDHADITSIAAADIVHDFLSLFVSAEPPKPRDKRKAKLPQGEQKPRAAHDEF